MTGLRGFGRDALLLETLSIVANCQDQERFWADAMGRLKWILEFTRVDVALRNPGEETYNLQTVFELRPDAAFISQAALPLGKGIVGKMMRSGEACHCFNPRTQPFARENIVDESLEGGSLSSILSVSLEANHELLGVLSFGTVGDLEYCYRDIEVASRFATHAAAAIQNWQYLTRLSDNAALLNLATDKLKGSHAALESLVTRRTTALRSLSRRLLKTQDEERRRVARDLHDSTGQTLAALKMSIAALQKRFLSDPGTSAALTDIAGIADRALQEIRTTSYLLHPPLLDEAGLVSTIRWYAKGFSQRSGIQVDLDCPFESGRLPGDVEMALFRVLQESLTNVHRHSKASRVLVRLKQNRKSAILEVQDNGCGVAPESLERLPKAGIGGGVGVTGMRERISELNGQLEMESSSAGTTLRAKVPLLVSAEN